MKNSKEKMSIAEFKKILAKAKENGATIVGLFNWTEPFLHPEITKFVKEIADNGIRCILSSNLALPDIPTLIDTLDAGVSELSVSVSGFTNDMYQINHKGGDVEVVKRNLTTISKYLSQSSKDINVCVKYLEFDYNKEQITDFEEFSESLRLNFTVHPASGNPLEPIPDDMSNVNEIIVDTHKMHTLETLLTNPCELLFDFVTLDYKGDAYLCCAHGNFDKYKIGNFLEINYEKMMLLRLFHPQCRTCVMFRRSPSNEDITDIYKWFSKSFLGEEVPSVGKMHDLSAVSLVENSIQVESNGIDPHFKDSLMGQGLVQGAVIECEHRVAELNNSIAMRDARIVELDRLVAERDCQIGEILSSTSWRVSSPLRQVKEWLKTT